MLAAVLPVFFSQVAGATLPSAATATRYYTTAAALALLVVALISPVLGTLADLGRRKKRFLAGSIALGVAATALLTALGEGDWLPALGLAILGQVGFATGNVFYDSLLPHVARPADQDRVSARGYAIGYLGGGLLLAINAVMIFVLGEVVGARLSFLSVAIWWAVFSIPILRRVPEPPADTGPQQKDGGGLVGASFARLRATLAHLRNYRQLFRFLIAFLIYNDGINTVILVAAIYGAELGFPTELLVLAILLVQFAGIPAALLFGRIPDRAEPRREAFLAFVLFNLVALPLVGIAGARALPADVAGRPAAGFETVDLFVGEGEYAPGSTPALFFDGPFAVTVDEARSPQPGATVRFTYNGRELIYTYSSGPDRSDWAVLIDGEPVDDDGEPLIIEGYNRVERTGEDIRIDPGTAGLHTLEVVNTGVGDEDATGTVISFEQVEVLEPTRDASLAALFGLLALLEAGGWAFAITAGRRLAAPLAPAMDTKRTLFLSLVVYTVVTVWGFFLDTVIEFWALALMVALVQGGSQALSRSLYASMSPVAKSGEFFGFYSVVSKFSAVLGPLLFALTIAVFDSSRPAVLALAAFFLVGGWILLGVDVEEGRRVARADDAGTLE